MSELDRELAGLRDSLQESVRQPEIREVVLRSRQRTTRRRMQVGAVAAVLLVGAAIPVLRTPFQPAPDEATAPAAVPSDPAGRGGDFGPPGRVPDMSNPWISDINFADDKHGYAIRTVCVSEPPDYPCKNELLATDDGEHWQVRNLPEGMSSEAIAGRMLVLRPRQLVLGNSFPEPNPDRWYSPDAGQTWQKVPGEFAPPVEAIPDGGTLDFVCAADSTAGMNCTKTSLSVTLPDSGRAARLASAPALDLMRPAPIPAADGNWWVSGMLPGTGRWAVAVSRDAGRTWSVAAMPEQSGPPFVDLIISVGPDAVYATAIGRLPYLENGLITIFRSTDGGRSWEQTWQASDTNDPRSIGGLPIAAADGRLIVRTEPGAEYVSTDGGKTFTPTGPIGAAGYVQWTRAGYLRTSTRIPTNTYHLSRDGIHWKGLVIG